MNLVRYGNRRTVLGIYVDLLKIIRDHEGIQLTKLILRSRLCHQKTVRLLKYLEEKGLVVVTLVGDYKTFSLNDKGYSFLLAVSECEERLNTFGVDLI